MGVAAIGEFGQNGGNSQSLFFRAEYQRRQQPAVVGRQTRPDGEFSGLTHEPAAREDGLQSG